MINCAEVGLSRAALWYVGQFYHEISREAAKILHLIAIMSKMRAGFNFVPLH